MATITYLADLTNSTSGSKSPAGTPVLRDLIVLMTYHTGTTASVAPTDNNSGGAGTYTLIETRLKGTNVDILQCWVRNSLIGAATSTTFTHNPGATTGGGVIVYRVTNMQRVGLQAVRQSGGQANATGTPQIVFGVSTFTKNPIIGIVLNATSPSGITQPTGFTEQPDITYTVPDTGIEVAFVSSGFANTTLTWESTSASEFASIAIELDESSVFIDEMFRAGTRAIGLRPMASARGRVNNLITVPMVVTAPDLLQVSTIPNHVNRQYRIVSF